LLDEDGEQFFYNDILNSSPSLGNLDILAFKPKEGSGITLE
jgi:hypothetical protein